MANAPFCECRPQTCRSHPAWRVAILLAVLAGCHRKEPEPVVMEPSVSDDASLAFDLETLPAANGAHQWIGVYRAQGKVARFRIVIEPSKSSTSQDSGFNIQFGSGRFDPEAGSDSTILLADLQKVLQAQKLPVPAPQKISVPFTFANFGGGLSHTAGGGFSLTPRGNWTALKIFLGQGDNEGEVFLNFNPKARKGMFSMKDSDYGDLVLAQLAKVL